MPEPLAPSTARPPASCRHGLLLCGVALLALALAFLGWQAALLGSQFPGDGVLVVVALAYGFGFSAWLAWQIIDTSRRLRYQERRARAAIAEATAALEAHAARQTQALQLEIDVRKTLENRLQHTLDAVYRQLANQRDLTALVSHEFRTPLTIIDTASQSLEMLDCGADPDAARRISRIRRAVRRLDALVSGLQNADRLEREHAALERRPVQLAELAQRVVASFSPDHAVVLHVRAEPCVEGDASLLDIALANLVGNALKYAGAAGPVTVTVDVREGEAVVEVADVGPGIAEADLEHVFERFYRGANADAGSGAGLGLFLTRRVVELHQGRIRARSVQGDGCTFTLSLPIAAEVAAMHA